MIKTKVLRLKRFGWKRIAKNVQRFGWTMSDAEEETTTTTETSYTGEIVNNKVYITPHKTSHTSIVVWLSFFRDKDKFYNLYAITFIHGHILDKANSGESIASCHFSHVYSGRRQPVNS